MASARAIQTITPALGGDSAAAGRGVPLGLGPPPLPLRDVGGCVPGPLRHGWRGWLAAWPRDLCLDLLEASGDLVVIVDPSTLEVCFLNRAARDATGAGDPASGGAIPLSRLYPAETYGELLRLALPAAFDTGRWRGPALLASPRGATVLVDQEVFGRCAPDGTPQWLAILARDITSREQTESRLRQLSQAVEQSPASVVITDTSGRIEYVNPKFCAVTGYSPHEVLGQNPRVLKSGDMSDEGYRDLWQTILDGREWRGELHNRKKNGDLYWEWAAVSSIKNANGDITHFIAVKEDITARKAAEHARDELEIQLRHAQKLESIGQLAAGIAHEINTPAQYVGDSLHFLEEAFGDVSHVVSKYQEAVTSLATSSANASVVQELADVEAAIDLPYLQANVPPSVRRCIEGVGRVGDIVRAMKEFAHPDQREKVPADINNAIGGTLVIARNEYKYVADVETVFGDLPLVRCHIGDVNQVVLNLIVNAAHAIGDVVGTTGARGRIAVTTRCDGERICIDVSDSGAGIPREIRDRVFEPFFTTKAVGKGSGQGLAIARSIVVDKHQGTLTFVSEPGRGTTFTIGLPVGTPGPDDAGSRT